MSLRTDHSQCHMYLLLTTTNIAAKYRLMQNYLIDERTYTIREWFTFFAIRCNLIVSSLPVLLGISFSFVSVLNITKQVNNHDKWVLSRTVVWYRPTHILLGVCKTIGVIKWLFQWQMQPELYVLAENMKQNKAEQNHVHVNIIKKADCLPSSCSLFLSA